MRAERVARWAILTVVVAGVLAVIGGVVSAALWQPDRDSATAPPRTCPDPPCLGLDGLPGLTDLGTVVPVALLGVAVLLGTLSFVVALVPGTRARGRRSLVLAVIAAAGPLVVLVGGEALPHLLSPCAPAELWGADVPAVCVRSPDGLDLPERWHALDHALVGFLPLSLGLAWSWRRVAARTGST